MMNVTGNPDGSSAVDYTVNCALGFPFVTGPAHGAAAVNPVNQVLPAWDAAAGVTAALGILAAERHRRLTSAGQLVKLPLADVAFAMTGNLVFAFGGLLTLSLSRLLSAIRLKCLQRLQIHLARLGQVRDVLMFVDLLATRFDSRQRKFGCLRGSSRRKANVGPAFLQAGVAHDLFRFPLLLVVRRTALRPRAQETQQHDSLDTTFTRVIREDPNKRGLRTSCRAAFRSAARESRLLNSARF